MTRRDDDLWAGVLDLSQWALWTAQPAVVFIIFSRFLALNSQDVCVTNKHPLPASSYEAHVYIIDKELLLRVVISNLHQLAEVLNPYIGYYRLLKIFILY